MTVADTKPDVRTPSSPSRQAPPPSRASRSTWLVSHRVQRVLIVATDAAAITAAAIAAFALRGWLPFDELPEDGVGAVRATALGAAAWLLMLHLFDAHSLRHARAGATEYKRLLMASATVAGMAAIACYLARYDYPRGIYAAWFVLGTPAMIVVRHGRRAAMRRFHRQGLLQTPVIIAGAGRHIDSVARVLHREQWLGYLIVGAITRSAESAPASRIPVLGTFDELRSVIARYGVQTVIFAEGSFDSPAEFRRLAWKLEDRNVAMIVVPTLADISSHRLDVRPAAGLPLVDVERPRAIAAGRWIKRAFDVVASAALLLLVAPILAVTAAAIKLEDGGPVIFRQRRVGIGGEEFDCLKFRSMCTDAEAKLGALMARNEGAGVLFKMTDDPRITRVGRFIRRFSIDELPQLWNAFRGDMSLVGPRPALPREVAQYDRDTLRRLDVRPGLTGLWQVSGRSNLPWEDAVRLDLYYVDNWSMTQDLMILAKTVKAVVGSDGAY